MKLPITVSKLEKMKLFARGNPQKIAEYTSANQKFMELITTYFDDEYPYTYRHQNCILKNWRKRRVRVMRRLLCGMS